MAGSPGPAGTSSGRAQSAILIPVPAAEAVVGEWRRAHDPVAVAGVPAHITLIVPWLPPAGIGQPDLDELEGLAAATPGWDFALRDVAWFSRRVLWLAPEPVEPFQHLTSVLAERFGTPPWAGEFEEVVPHLTVAHAGGDPVGMARCEAALRRRLPMHGRATEIWVMVGDGRRWSVRAAYPLGDPVS